MPTDREYWTTEMFVKQAPLYGEVLAALKPAAVREVRGIRRIFAREGIPIRGRVLDIACGIGRHIIPLAEAGYRAVGCDFSPGLIRVARNEAIQDGLSAIQIRFYVTDYRRIDTALKRAGEAPFDAAICIFTSMGHYGEKGDLAVLRAVRRVVRPGGLFIMEMGDRDWILRNYEPVGVSHIRPGLEIRERRSFDWERSVVHSTWKFYRGTNRRKRKVFEQEISVRQYSLHELRSLFERAGWDYIRSYGSLTTLEPVSLRSRRLVVVGRRGNRESRGGPRRGERPASVQRGPVRVRAERVRALRPRGRTPVRSSDLLQKFENPTFDRP